jgi:hypothetical protein
LAALGFPCGARNDMQALYTKRCGRRGDPRENKARARIVQFPKPSLVRLEAYREEICVALTLFAALDCWRRRRLHKLRAITFPRPQSLLIPRPLRKNPPLPRDTSILRNCKKKLTNWRARHKPFRLTWPASAKASCPKTRSKN